MNTQVKNRVNMRDKTTLPNVDEVVTLHGSDCFGDWSVDGYLKNFKSPPHKKSLPYRFVNTKGERIHYVEAWSSKV